jgi:hypothetical protein
MGESSRKGSVPVPRNEADTEIEPEILLDVPIQARALGTPVQARARPLSARSYAAVLGRRPSAPPGEHDGGRARRLRGVSGPELVGSIR